MKYGIYTEEFGWVQSFSEYTEKNGHNNRLEFSTKQEAEDFLRSGGWREGATVKEIVDTE